MSNNTVRGYKYFTLLATIYVAIFCVNHILTNRLVSIHGFFMSAGTFAVPFYYFLSDVIAEVYGYKLARQLVWMSLLNVLIIAIIVTVINKLPAPPAWDGQAAYKTVLSPVLRVAIVTIIASIVSSFLNIYIISKLKILVRGKYFWLRSIGASAVGEAIFVVIVCMLVFYGQLPLMKILEITLASYATKILCSIIFATPAAILVIVLKKAEKIDQYDYYTNFNPFKLDVTYDDTSKG